MVDHELNELRREFLDEARDKVAEMQSAIAEERSASTLERVSYLAHQLKGSGGSYGFQRISADAAELEKAIERNGDGDLARYVTNLSNAVESAAREL